MKNHKSLFINRFFFVISALLVVGIGIFIYSYFFSKPAIASWFDESWLYRQTVNITNTGSAQTDFQSMITLNTQTLATAGKIQTSCNDLRITDINGNLLKFWIEPTTCNTATTKIWVKVPTLPASGASLYLYYGNPSASTGQAQTTEVFIREISNVQGSWTLDETSGNINDSSGNGITGTNNGTTTFTTGKFGNAGSFNGSSQFFSGTLSPDIANSSFTISSWINETNSASARIWFSVGDTQGTNITLHLRVESGGAIKFGFYDNDLTSPGSTFVAGQWNHVVATYDSTTGKRYIYYNGTQVATDTSNAAFSGTAAFNIGKWAPYSIQYWLGSIDDTRVYNKALSQAEITDLYGTGGDRQGYTTTNYANKELIRKYSSSVTTGSPASEEQGPGPVGYWKFDDGQGTTAQDSSSSNNDGTITGATWTTEDQCVSGKCLFFDGSTSNVVSTNNLTGVTTGVTVEAWIRPTSLATDSIIAQSYLWQAGSGGPQLILRSTGRVDFDINNNATTYEARSAVGAVTVNKWYHLVGTWDGSTVKVYVSAVAGPTTASLASPINNPGTTITIGKRSPDNDLYFNGFIDDIKIYPYARTQAQILADYNSRSSQIGTSVQIGPENQWLSQGLVGYWKMDETSWNGTSGEVIDASGNGNNGTAGGSATTAAGKFGNGGSFNGTSQYAGFSDFQNNLQKFTISSWIYPTSVTGRREIMNKYGIYLNIQSSQLNVYVSGVSSSYLNTSTTLSTNTWSFVTATWDGTTIKLFINGVQQASTALSGTSSGSGSSESIGRQTYGGPGSYFAGTIDEIRVYNRALTSAEISSLYNFAPGPVAYYDFEDATGSTLSDRSGYGNNGTWAGTGVKHWDTGKVGKAGKFNGTDDYVDAGNQSVLSFTKSFTIGSWVKTTAAAVQYIFTKSNASTGNNSYLFAILANGKLQFYLNGQASCVAETAFVRTGNSAVNDGKWHYVSGVYDSVAQTLDVYVDGNKDNGTLSGTIATSIPDCSRNARIGLSADNYYYFNGQIDEVKLYNYARTQKQIVSDMGGGSPSTSSGRSGGPIGYWKFDEGQGTTANNFGNGGSTLNGTLTGMSSPATSTSGWTPSGKFGKGLIFDGSNDYVDLTDLSTYDIPSSGSVFLSAWVKTSSATTQDVFSNYGCTQHYYRIAVNSTGVIYFNDRGTTDTPDEVAGIKSINDGNWHHIAAGRNGTTGKLEIYVDGVLDKQQSVIHTDAISPTVNGSIGRNRSTCNSQNYFNGSIDEVKIYNYALTSEEILTDYNKGSSLIMGAAGNNSSYAPQAANQQYCVPGDTTSCVAPVAEWNFEEGIGTSVNDSSGNANTGTWSGTGTQHWTTGKVGKAGKFNGTDDYVNVVDSSILDGWSSATFSVWVKNTGSDGTIFSKATGGGNGNYWLVIVSNQIHYALKQNWNDYNSNVTLPVNEWHHIELTVDPANTTARLYLDGVLKDTQTITNTPFIDNSISLNIGKMNAENGGGTFFSGQIDQVKIFNYARSAAQIAWDYNRGAPVGHWKFDECQGSVAHDISDNSNHGTITIGASGEDTLGTCTTSSTAWGSGATGKYNSSMSFDGIDDYVDMGNPSNGLYNFGANNFSLSAWIKAAVHGVYSVVDIVSKDNSGARQFSFFKNAGSADDIRFSIFVGGSEVSLTTATNVITDTNWHHVTAVRSGTNAYIYVDGVLVKSGAMSGTMDITSTTLKVGASDWGHYFKGQIDDVKVFNYALTPLQIKTLYNNGAVYFGPTSGTP